MADEPNTDAKDPTTENPSSTPAAEDNQQPPTDGANPDEKKPEEITFTPEQQKKIDDIINDRLGTVKKKTSAELEAERTAKAELATKLKEIEDAKAKADEDARAKELEKAREKGEFEKVAKLKEEEFTRTVKAKETEVATLTAERDSLRTELEKTKIDSALLAAASTRAINAAQVVRLLKDEHKIALDPKTNTVTVDGDTDVSLDVLVNGFLDKNDHLDKSKYAGKAGAGSPPGAPTSSGTKTYTAAQYADFDYYKANQADMDRAQVEGRVVG